MHVLSINVGSSTIKFAIFKLEKGVLKDVVRGSFKHIGNSESVFSYTINRVNETENLRLNNETEAIEHLAKWLTIQHEVSIGCIAHRLVHGGTTYSQPQVIDKAMMRALEECIPLAPDHLPSAISVIKVMQRVYSDVKQIACFDTAFHRHLPEVAKTLPFSDKINHHTIHKYGFHGLSYEYIYSRLRKLYAEAKQKRIVIAHLGNGASMAAVKEGRCIDTTMGFTPSGGLVMGSRTGDIDPGVLIYLLQQEHFTAKELNHAINDEGGLKGISGLSSDMKVLLENEATNSKAKLAVDVFCYQAAKHLASLIAVLGGVDVLVFTGGIGAAAPAIRARICANMGFAGIQLNPEHNEQNQLVISAEGGSVTVHVLETNEEEQIATHAIALTTKNKDHELPD